MYLLLLLLSFYFAIEPGNSYQNATLPKECLHIIHNDFSNCIGAETEGPPPNDTDLFESKCMEERICRKTFRLSSVELPPFSRGMENHIRHMLTNCCGKCAVSTIVDRFKDVSHVTVKSLHSSDIIFPIFSRSDNEKLYGFWFIPIIDIPDAYYVRKKRTNEEMLRDMLNRFARLWPLLVICLLFALLAGFFAWILETWRNKDEFPRPFLDGTFEGFWWSFISMTTVGYGDKAPRSRTARLFSIGWILIGMTIFSMFTASLTTIITNVEKIPSADMAGKTVGALKNRVYDAVVIAKHGGMIHAVDHNNFTSGISLLLDILFEKTKVIDGFLLDRHSYYYYRQAGRDKRLLNTIHAVKTINKEKLSYGMLVRNTDDYFYFRKYITDNWFALDTCMNLMMNKVTTQYDASRVASYDGALTIESGLFRSFLFGIGVAVGVILVFGVFYEIWRHNNDYCCQKGLNHSEKSVMNSLNEQ